MQKLVRKVKFFLSKWQQKIASDRKICNVMKNCFCNQSQMHLFFNLSFYLLASLAR